VKKAKTLILINSRRNIHHETANPRFEPVFWLKHPEVELVVATHLELEGFLRIFAIFRIFERP
jgi:hypothetical protein